MKTLRVLYAGSPKAASTTLKLLVEKSKKAESFEIVGVLTNPPSPQGRHKTIIETPVATVAKSYAIPLLEFPHLDATAREAVEKIKPDILVCFAYGHIFGLKFMSLFRFGGINLHPSLLPKYRGPSPVNACILNQDDKTAWTIQKISEKMDEGNILAQKIIPLDKTETAESLLNQASVEGVDLFFLVLEEIAKNEKVPEGIPQIVPLSEGRLQCEMPTYTKIITKDDAKIDWKKSASEIDAFVRAYYSSPIAWTFVNGETIKILSGFALSETDACVTQKMKNAKVCEVCEFIKSKGIIVKCGIDFFAITHLQKQGKNAMDYKSFMNGNQGFVGKVFE